MIETNNPLREKNELDLSYACAKLNGLLKRSARETDNPNTKSEMVSSRNANNIVYNPRDVFTNINS